MEIEKFYRRLTFLDAKLRFFYNFNFIVSKTFLDVMIVLKINIALWV
jgi:hypothetical protein